MIQFNLPAKTFFVGEYAALYGGPALLVTTTPCFGITWSNKITRHNESRLRGIHPDSPAGRWWLSSKHHRGILEWQDPYQGRGGLGASSAQFLGAFLASCHCLNQEPQLTDMFNAFQQTCKHEAGILPSGYDVLAQSQNQFVAINRQERVLQTYPWPFADIDFFLVHSGKKIQTHEHLKNIQLHASFIKELSSIAHQTQMAFINTNSNQLIDSINAYSKSLFTNQLVTENTITSLIAFHECEYISASKGCGALGADVLLLITTRNDAAKLEAKLRDEQKLILATSADIYREKPILKNNPQKALDFLL